MNPIIPLLIGIYLLPLVIVWQTTKKTKWWVTGVAIIALAIFMFTAGRQLGMFVECHIENWGRYWSRDCGIVSFVIFPVASILLLVSGIIALMYRHYKK